MAEISPLRRRMIEDMTGPQSVAGDATIVPQCEVEVQARSAQSSTRAAEYSPGRHQR